MLKDIGKELKTHMPFTLLGTLSGVVILLIFVHFPSVQGISHDAFYTLHPLHVFLSALTTAAMFRLHSKSRPIMTILVGYVGAVGIGTLSDSLIPYLGELLIGLKHAEAHIGFIEKWWLVNPLALAGVAVAFIHPRTKVPHAGHVLLSTWASLSHFLMAMDTSQPVTIKVVIVPVFLFLAVWAPCCTSDIVFPLLVARGGCQVPNCPHHHKD